MKCLDVPLTPLDIFQDSERTSSMFGDYKVTLFNFLSNRAFHIVTYISRLQHGGFSIRCPALRCWYIYCPGTVGYGVPPRVMISQSNTPNDQLKSGYVFHIYSFNKIPTWWSKASVISFGKIYSLENGRWCHNLEIETAMSACWFIGLPKKRWFCHSNNYNDAS